MAREARPALRDRIEGAEEDIEKWHMLRVGKGKELRKAIESCSGERAVHRQLEQNPWVFFRLFQYTYPGYVISHFSLGDEFEADFVVMTAYSGGWFVYFVELEPSSLRPFNRSGVYSKRLNHAADQIRNWKLFIERPEKKIYLISQLCRAAKTRELYWGDGREPKCRASLRFDDPNSCHTFYFHVLMGRRYHLNEAQMTKKAGLLKTDGFELITYDRVLDLLKA